MNSQGIFQSIFKNPATAGISSAGILYVAASNPLYGDGTLYNPFKHIDYARQYIIDNGLQGLGYTVFILNGSFSTALNYAVGFKIDGFQFSIDYTGTDWLFQDIGYDLYVGGQGTYTSNTGGWIKYGGNNRIKQLEWVSVTTEKTALDFSSGTFGFTTIVFQGGPITVNGANQYTLVNVNFDHYGGFKNTTFNNLQYICYTAQTRNLTLFESCNFDTPSNTNANPLVYIPAGVPVNFYYQIFKGCAFNLRAANKCIQVDTALVYSAASQQLLWLEGNTFYGVYSFGPLQTPLFSNVNSQFVGITNSIRRNYATSQPTAYTSGTGVFSNIATPAFDPITV